MSTPWITLSVGADLQQSNLINQILRGIRERRESAKFVSLGFEDLVAGNDVHQGYFWESNQRNVEACAEHFVDHDDASPAPDKPLLTAARHREIAQIHENGWRRATTWPSDWTDLDDPAYSYGYAQVGDIYGPWIFDDLQKMLTALKWTRPQATTYGATYKTASGGDLPPPDATCDDAKANQDALWSLAGWYSGPHLYYVSGRTSGDAGGWGAEAYRFKSYPRAYLPVHIPADVECWLKFSAPVGSFYDFDGLGVADGGVLLWGTKEDSQVSPVTFDLLVDSTANPIFDVPCPGELSIQATQYPIAKWHFTNA